MKHTKLFEAINEGNFNFLVENVKKNPELINIRDYTGSTVLQIFAQSSWAIDNPDYQKVFNYLITMEGADLYARDNQQRNLIIKFAEIFAFYMSNTNFINSLDSLLSLPNFKTKEEGEYFFLYLIKESKGRNSPTFWEFEDLIDKLLTYKANINVRDQENRTLLKEFLANLYWPRYYKQFPIILNKFLKRGALIDSNIIQDLYSYKDIPVKSYSHFLDQNGDSVLHLFAKHFTKREDNDFLVVLSDCEPCHLYDKNRHGDTVMHIIASKIRERRADLYGSFLNFEKIEEDKTIKDLRQIIEKIKNIVDLIQEDLGKIDEITNNIGETSSEIVNSDLFDKDSFELMTEAKARLLLRQLDYFSAKETLAKKGNVTVFELNSRLQSELRNIISTSLTLSNVNTQDFEGNTALHLALKGKNLILALALMKHNPDKYIKNHAGDLPIHFAAEQGMFQEEILKIYDIKDFSIRNANGLDSFDLIASKSLASVNKIIESSGLKIEEQDPSNIPSPRINHFKREISPINNIIFTG